MELQMTAHLADAVEALQLGLVNHVTTAETLLEKTTAILNIIMSKAPVAISKIIECINIAVVSDSAFTNGKTGFDKEVQSFGECFVTEDMKEGTTAFLEKRKANFTGK
jgi:enoyl-CoA hydratase